MTCTIARQADEHHTALWLIGYLQGTHLKALQAHMESNGPRAVLDLDDVTLVEAEVPPRSLERLRPYMREPGNA